MNYPNISDLNRMPIQSDPTLNSYYCPHCNKFLFKGNIKKLNMVCMDCQKLINADGNDLVNPKSKQI